MAWKPSGQPKVRQQRDKWVVRIDGIDTITGNDRPRQLGTYPSKRAATKAASEFAAKRDTGGDRQTVGAYVKQWAAGRVDVAPNTREQYEWAAGHIAAGIGAIRLDRLEREDIARWLDDLASTGEKSRRSIQIFRTVLRAALDEAVDVGDINRSPAARVGMPRQVAKKDRVKDVDAWDEADLRKFLAVAKQHRWGPPLRLAALYGLRRSELIGLQWGDIDLAKKTVRIERGLVAVSNGPKWSDGKNARSRRVIPIDTSMAKELTAHRRFQMEERLAAGSEWEDNDLVVATRDGRHVSPRNFDQSLERIVSNAGVPRLTSHGLRHTAATHMVRHASDIGEIRAAADVLGHSPDMLMKTYAHALPESVRTVTDKIARRAR
ncbi:MAG: integrase family protein, partial [Acidimicrobiales bacterium]|nr:integrase family protein [Acidimicrobiales bacterium]